MLQQTQVSRVAERFPRFVARFPSIRALAASTLEEVLQEWEGMGYYRRARLLHAAARAIVQHHRGRVPSDVGELRSLPGVGPYTAGAVASIAFGRREAIVDGNVARVLIRIAGRPVAADEPEAIGWCWSRSRELVLEASDPGSLNESLMELGATVCTPRSPSCSDCPISSRCVARREGTPERLPLPKRRPRRTRLVQHVLLAPPRREGRRLLATVRRRAPEGLWGGMWEFPTIESPRRLQARTIAKRLGVAVGTLRRIESFPHATTHRDVEFVVFELASAPPSSAFDGVDRIEFDRLREIAMSVPQRRIAEDFVSRWRPSASQTSSRRPEARPESASPAAIDVVAAPAAEDSPSAAATSEVDR